MTVTFGSVCSGIEAAIVGVLFDHYVYTGRLRNFLAYLLGRIKRKFKKDWQK